MYWYLNQRITASQGKIILVCCIVLLAVACASTSYPGFTIASPPQYYNPGLHNQCARYFDEWTELSRVEIHPELGVSRIKAILSATHQLGMTYLEGCPEIGISSDYEKGVLYLSAANEFSYPPARLALGILALEGKILEQDIDLARKYILFAYHCDITSARSYGGIAEPHIIENNWPYHKARKNLWRGCPGQGPADTYMGQQFHIRLFDGPNQEFNRVAYESERLGRLDESRQRWGWIGDTLNMTGDAVGVLLPVALMGAAAYYTAKSGTAAPATTAPQSELAPLKIAAEKACSTDGECGFGSVCVKPRGSFSFTGVCGTLIDQSGRALGENWSLNIGPRDVRSCRSRADCPYGFQCQVVDHLGQGICSR